MANAHLFCVAVAVRMQPPLDEFEKKKIIDMYLEGISPQSQIALLVNRSEGAVSNVIRDFIRRFGQRDVNAMRTMAIAMQKSLISAEQSVEGFRMRRQLLAMGISTYGHDDLTIESLQAFVNDIFMPAKDSGLPEDKVIEYMRQLFKVSINEAVEPSEVPKYIEEKIKAKKKVEDEFEELEAEINAKRDEKNKAIQDANVTKADLEQFTFVREELNKHSLQINDIPKLVNALNNAEQLNYNATKIAARLSEEESMGQKVDTQAGVLVQLKDEVATTVKELKRLEEQVNSNRALVTEINEMKEMGCASELRALRGKITGIVKAAARRGKKVTLQRAFKKLIEDIEKSYDNVTGFEEIEKKVGKLSEQYAKLQIDVPLLEQQKREAENYIKNVLPEFTNRLDNFTRQIGLAEQKMHDVPINPETNQEDFHDLLEQKEIRRLQKLIKARYEGGEATFKDHIDNLYTALDLTIRQLSYESDDSGLKQTDRYKLNKELLKVRASLAYPLSNLVSHQLADQQMSESRGQKNLN